MKKHKALNADQLRKPTDVSLLDFETTEEIIAERNFVGQKRALDALQFGIAIEGEGYNIFALGDPGVGKRALIRSVLTERALKEPTPSDWCYVNHFVNPEKPFAIELPAGFGNKFRQDMELLMIDLRSSIPAVFEGEEYRTKMQNLTDEIATEQSRELKKISDAAKKEGLAIVSTSQGFAVLPVNHNNEVMAEGEYGKLPEEEHQKKEQLINHYSEKIAEFLKKIPGIHKERRNKENEIKQEYAHLSVVHFIDELKEKYQSFPKVTQYLEDMLHDVILNIKDFLRSEDNTQLSFLINEKKRFSRYEVNVIIDNSHSKGAPIIFEQNPTYQNLICRVDHVTQLGTLYTDFSLIKGGALHKANGGYLIIDAAKLFHHPFAWEGLKRALFAREITIEPPEKMIGMISSPSLEPSPIPSRVKVILFGTSKLYYLLAALDPEFNDLFKIAVDFEDSIDRSPENVKAISEHIATLIKKAKVRPFHRDAIAAILDQSSRLSGDNEKISNHCRSINNLVLEAAFVAKEKSHAIVQAEDVIKAIAKQNYRMDKSKEELYELYKNENIIAETEGKKIGQINGLAIAEIGSHLIGKPTRITAKVHYGTNGVIDIMRESKLGGPIHTKGVLILSGFISGRYYTEGSLALSASLVFEQSYGAIDGDSASAAELCALLSALSEIPLKQSLAITGSIDQHGRIQAIGAVNEKIEGFYDICKIKGITGKQGVIIPKTNTRNLMLREDIVQAVRLKKFNIYTVETIDEALYLLTDEIAGKRNKNDKFPKGSINYWVENRLKLFSKLHNNKKERVKHEYR